MMYLLDVNALIAMGYPRHVHHERVRQWSHPFDQAKADVLLATCAITELGFIRIASSNVALTEDLSTAQEDLRRLKAERVFAFLNDALDAEQMPEWVTRSKQTTDGHLMELAAHHQFKLATLDRGIIGAELIPQIDTEWMVREEPARYGIAA